MPPRLPTKKQILERVRITQTPKVYAAVMKLRTKAQLIAALALLMHVRTSTATSTIATVTSKTATSSEVRRKIHPPKLVTMFPECILPKSVIDSLLNGFSLALPLSTATGTMLSTAELVKISGRKSGAGTKRVPTPVGEGGVGRSVRTATFPGLLKLARSAGHSEKLCHSGFAAIESRGRGRIDIQLTKRMCDMAGITAAIHASGVVAFLQDLNAEAGTTTTTTTTTTTSAVCDTVCERKRTEGKTRAKDDPDNKIGSKPTRRKKERHLRIKTINLMIVEPGAEDQAVHTDVAGAITGRNFWTVFVPLNHVTVDMGGTQFFTRKPSTKTVGSMVSQSSNLYDEMSKGSRDETRGFVLRNLGKLGEEYAFRGNVWHRGLANRSTTEPRLLFYFALSCHKDANSTVVDYSSP